MSLEERRRSAEEAARSRLRAQSADLERRAAEPLAAGDLLWLPATAGLPVEWAVVELGASNLTLVPADTNPSAGGADLAVAGEHGPLTLRCGFAARLPAERLGAYRRTGRIPAPAIEAVRPRLAAPGFGGGGADEDPEYADWIAEAIQPARQALDPADSTNPVAAPRVPRVSRRSRGLELAASALLAAGVALAGSRLWQDERIREIEADKAQLAERLERRLGDLESRAAAGDRAARETAALRERLARAESRSAPVLRPEPPRATAVEPLLNPPIEWFQPATGALRGEERRVAVPPAADAERFFFVLETWSTKPYPRYRVALLGPGGEAPVWQSDGLVAQGEAEIVFGLPARHLSVGAHAFQLYGLGGLGEEAVVALERFPFRVERSGPHR